jgi:hypothetical protein
MSQPTKSSIMISGGTYFDPLNPRAQDINVNALQRGLVLPRFNGQTTEFVPIDGHMVRCALIWIALRKFGVSLSREHHVLTPIEWLDVLLALLLHDVGEGLIGDRLSPIKTDQDRELERGVLAACIEHLLCLARMQCGSHDKTPHPRHTEILVVALYSQHVKDVDWISCRVEALLWQPGAYDWAAPSASEREAFCLAFSVATRYHSWLSMLQVVYAAWVEANARPERAEILINDLVARFG